MSMNLVYNKKMGFAINGVAIPDPASYGYKSQSVDVSAERDTKALLHRKMVAVKRNVSLSWNALDYETASSIVQAVQADKFTLTFPCPEIVGGTGLYTGDYYAGDRSLDFLKATDENDKGKWLVSMSFDCIEY